MAHLVTRTREITAIPAGAWHVLSRATNLLYLLFHSGSMKLQLWSSSSRRGWSLELRTASCRSLWFPPAPILTMTALLCSSVRFSLLSFAPGALTTTGLLRGPALPLLPPPLRTFFFNLNYLFFVILIVIVLIVENCYCSDCGSLDYRLLSNLRSV